jgi:hypothetical protein
MTEKPETNEESPAQEHSLVEDEGENSSENHSVVGDDGKNSLTRTGEKAKRKRKPIGEQGKKPKLPGKINPSPQGKCVQPTEPSENESAHVNKSSQKNKGDGKDQPDGKYIQHTTLFTCILGPILFYIIVATIINKLSTPNSGNNNIVEEIEKLANDFQNQTPYSIKKLKSRVLSYIDHKTAPQPFVLLVAATQDDQQTAECFAKRVAQLLTTSSVVINGSKYSDTTSDNAKLDIDDRLRKVFQKGNFPTAAIIQNFDSIPYGTTNLFYAYCDHDNPMFKEAAIIFTITLPQDYHIVAVDHEHDREGLVEKYLSEDSPWVKDEKFSSDIMGALISRITDTVIVVNKESEESFKEKSC